ncbi:hypothetical protein GOP47_0010688 [Adiantum capillus-veneris]|uniref:Uncharacterized protein n=1 Tax=Adiantum capillus-veneris TaxID=13818 RepID=A0A9D4UWI4_ADICA|nr:hypothetical protein GOP47_0010688 [Adiantum capillus-veneris]
MATSTNQSSYDAASSSLITVKSVGVRLELIGHFKDFPCYMDDADNRYLKSKKNALKSPTIQVVEVDEATNRANSQKNLMEDRLGSVYMKLKLGSELDIIKLHRQDLPEVSSCRVTVHLIKSNYKDKNCSSLYRDMEGRWYKAETPQQATEEPDQCFIAHEDGSKLGYKYMTTSGNIYRLIMSLPLASNADTMVAQNREITQETGPTIINLPKNEDTVSRKEFLEAMCK